MPYCIMVRDLDPTLDGVAKVLATDIPNPLSAGGLVERIASSYPGNGIGPTARRRWFRDGDGLHEIWVEPLSNAFVLGVPSRRRGVPANPQSGARPREAQRAVVARFT